MAMGRRLQAMLADPDVDVGLVGCVPLTPSLATLPPGPRDTRRMSPLADALASQLIALWDATTKPWVVVIDAGSPL